MITFFYKMGMEVPKNVTDVIFDSTDIFDSAVTEVSENAFRGCSNLKEVVLNEGLQKIGWAAFLRCILLTSIKLPSTVTEVGAYAFADCIDLEVVVLNHGLSNIGTYAFMRCQSLTIIKLPSTVTEVGEGAFGGCNNLKEVVFNEGLKIMRERPFKPHGGPLSYCH